MFSISQYLPVANKTVRYRELLNKHFISINKFITNGDDEGLAQYFELLLRELLETKENLRNIDKFLILVNLRSICVGNELVFQSKDEKSKVQLLVSSVLNKFQ